MEASSGPGPAVPDEAPDGIALLPEIPAELGVHPLLLATLHAYVFLDGSDRAIVHPSAASEALAYLVSYLQRLQGADLQRLQEDLHTLTAYAKAQRWPRQQVRFLQEFLKANGLPTSRPGVP